MKTWWRADQDSRPSVGCRGCHRSIVDIPEIGWVDAYPGGSYDLCDADPYGNHSPDLT